MTINTRCILIGLFAIALCHAREPAFRLGPRVTFSPNSAGVNYYDSLGRTIWAIYSEQPYVGAGIQAEYGPLWLCRVRVEIAQIRIYTHGGLDFSSFPLGGELTFEPPVNWRFLPYIYAGGELVGDLLGRSSLVDSITMIATPESHFRAGIGGRFALTRCVDLCGEVQMFSFDSRNVNHDIPLYERDVDSGFGIFRFHLGAQFALGK